MYKRGLKVGFIKGGQLGRMMLQAAGSFDIVPFVMDSDPHCPCRALCQNFVQGDEQSYDDVVSFGRSVDLLTFEYEHINAEALEYIQKQGVAVFPDPAILRMVQDKGKQKEFYRASGIPTGAYQLVSNRAELSTRVSAYPMIQKKRTAGYDGKGVYKISAPTDIAQAFDEPSVLEDFVDFDTEISVIVARNQRGETAVYPTVEMVFHPTKNLVEFLASPANISKEVDGKARRIATDLAGRLKVVGVLAVEMFVTRSGDVLVNEIAPRVHNSGHHTIEGNFTSQFEQHLRCIMGLPLGDAGMTSPAVMVNILGAEGCDGPARYQGIDEALALGGVFVHMYGKEHTKPYRKMGHATVIDPDVNQALAKARRVKDIIKVVT